MLFDKLEIMFIFKNFAKIALLLSHILKFYDISQLV